MYLPEHCPLFAGALSMATWGTRERQDPFGSSHCNDVQQVPQWNGELPKR